jgi:transcriptional regulator of acetoin/glycerol metabolism
MSSLETLQDPGASSLPGPMARVLTYVLHYDDLLADRSASFRLGGADELTIGRAEGTAPSGFASPAELRLQDRWVSSRHAVVRRTAKGDVIVDGGSRNGTWVNGERVTERALQGHDLVEVGHSLLCYRVVDQRTYEALVGPGAAPVLGPTRTHCAEVALLARDLGRIAPTPEPVLVLGETGTGKEVVAHALHELSGRRGELRALDCGAVPESLFESVFFGHRKGAFTGAGEARVGEVVRARGGTLLLDEVSNMSLAAQAKLLRVLEDGCVTALGASEAEKVDVRVVAATNRDLLAGGEGFRADLLRRLAGFVARLPPLRRRREDLGSLTAHLLREAGIERASIQSAAARALFCGGLPGNVRQLRTSLRSAAALAGGGPIDLAHLPPVEPAAPPDGEDRAQPAGAEAQAKGGAFAGPSPRARPDAAAVEAALAATRGNMVQAARRLGTHPRQLYRWVERLGIDVEKLRG